LEAGIITQVGAAWTFLGQKYRGKDKFKEAVENSPEMQAAIQTALQPHGKSEAPKKKVVRKRSAPSSEKA
jgi:hypothetical protein